MLRGVIFSQSSDSSPGSLCYLDATALIHFCLVEGLANSSSFDSSK